VHSEPAAPFEEAEQDCERDELGADADADERLPVPDLSGEPAEVLAEEAGQSAERQEDRGDHGQLFHHGVETV
jgi:hypothetical protein